MKIKKVEWISKEAKEAEVTVSDGKYELICFAHPFHLLVGDILRTPLYTICANNIKRSLEQNSKIEKKSGNYEYCITAQFINLGDNIVKLGNIDLELDVSIPQDIKFGEYISFCCDRIDIMD